MKAHIWKQLSWVGDRQCTRCGVTVMPDGHGGIIERPLHKPTAFSVIYGRPTRQVSEDCDAELTRKVMSS